MISRIAIAALCLLVSTSRGQSTATYCAVVKPTTDGFVALRTGPGTTFSIRQRLRPFDVVWVDTGSCRGRICDESGKWRFIEGVPRLDGPFNEARRFTQGWALASFIKQTACPTE